MHIPDGIIGISASEPEGMIALGIGVLGAAAGTAIGLRRIDYEQVPRVAMLSAAFFVISLIAVPTGIGSEHLMLVGLLGLILGWAAFPAILIALALQLMFFGMGGLTTLGLNTLNMALPAVLCHYCFRRAIRVQAPMPAAILGFLAGASAMIVAVVLYRAALWSAGTDLALVANVVSVMHLPLALLEGVITATTIGFLRQVRPELIHTPLLVMRGQEPADA